MIDVFDRDFEDNVIDFQINESELEESELEEKAGVRFVKNSKEYNISRVIQDKLTKKDFSINLDILKEKYPGINKENFSEDDYIGYPFENVIGITKLSDTDYKDFPEWVHSIYVVYFKKNEITKFAGAFKNDSISFSKDGKVSSFVILIHDYKNIDMTSTINHEIRHAYTEYINYKTKKRTDKEDYDNSIITNKNTSIAKTEIITFYYKIKNNEFYDNLKKDGHLTYDYKNEQNIKDRSSYAFFVNKLLYYLVDTELKSHTESAYNEIIEFYNDQIHSIVTPTEIYKTNSYCKLFKYIYNYILDLLKDPSKIKDWSKRNNNLLGILGAKVVASEHKRQITDSDKMDMTPWLKYKINQLKKIISNLSIHIEDEYKESGKDIYEFTFVIRGGKNYDNYKILMPKTVIKTNIKTVCFIYYLIYELFNSCNDKLFISIDVYLRRSKMDSSEIDIRNKTFARTYNTKIESFSKYLIQKKSINNETLIMKLKNIILCFNERVIIK